MDIPGCCNEAYKMLSHGCMEGPYRMDISGCCHEVYKMDHISFHTGVNLNNLFEINLTSSGLHCMPVLAESIKKFITKVSMFV